VVDDFSIQGISVDAKNAGGLGLISTGFRERALDESLFEFIQCFFQIDTTVDHLGHK